MSDRTFSSFLGNNHSFREKLTNTLNYNSECIMKAGLKLSGKWPQNPNFTWEILNSNKLGGQTGAARFINDCSSCGATCQDMWKALYSAGLELVATEMLNLAGVPMPASADMTASNLPLNSGGFQGLDTGIRSSAPAPAAAYTGDAEMIDLDEEITPMHEFIVLADMGQETIVVPTTAIKNEAKGRLGLQKICKMPKYDGKEVGLYTQLSVDSAAEKDVELQDNAEVIDLSDDEDEAPTRGVREIHLKKGTNLIGKRSGKVSVTIGGVKKEIKKGSTMSGLMIVKRSAFTNAVGKRDHKYQVVTPDEPIEEEEAYFELSTLLAESDKGSEYAVYLLVTSNKQPAPTVQTKVRARVIPAPRKGSASQKAGSKDNVKVNIPSSKIRDASVSEKDLNEETPTKKTPTKKSSKGDDSS